MTSKRRDCRGRKCTTVLHGGVCHRTSMPHKCGNKTKRKKTKAYVVFSAGYRTIISCSDK